jgi:hypothetical protein
VNVLETVTFLIQRLHKLFHEAPVLYVLEVREICVKKLCHAVFFEPGIRFALGRATASFNAGFMLSNAISTTNGILYNQTVCQAA